MLKIGIDFGSTYTVVSRYREESGKLEPIILGTGTPYIPTVVACEEGDPDREILFGRAAKESTDDEEYVVYKAFKMMLNENSPLSDRGYEGSVTPARIAELFLRDLVKRVCDHCGEPGVDQLVIGAPDIWFRGLNTISGRSTLYDICTGMEQVKREGVQVVSEPAAASAFFAYNYYLITHRPFEGSILLIDYGGGTLDISFSKVSAMATGANDAAGRQLMEIKVVESDGAGENMDRQIGKAAIVYMESVVQEAIYRAGVVERDTPIPTDNDFYRIVDKLEMRLQEDKTRIDDKFDDLGIRNLDELEEEELVTLRYHGKKLKITYALLVEVYNQVIRGVFREKLDHMISLIHERHGIDPRNTQDPTFKIALVGGFGNFYLVRKQMEEAFHFSAQDVRRKDIIINQSDCENAISFGTALLAAGLIGIRKTAPYSVGIFQRSFDGKPVLDYAFRYKQEINANEVCYFNGEDGKAISFWIGNGGISNLVINQDYDDREAIILPFKKEFSTRLQNLVSRKPAVASIGFSLDSSDILSIWVCERRSEPREIKLGKLEEMFDTTQVTRFVDLK